MHRRVLLAYGEKEFTKSLKTVLERQGHTVTILWEGDPPRAPYDLIIQLARDPAHLAEGTRLLLEKVKKDRGRLILVVRQLDEKLYEEAARFAQTLAEEAARRDEAEITILNLGRIYGPGIPLRDSGALGHLITEFAEGNILTLYGEGKDRDYYLFTADALEGIALAVEKAAAGETYALAPSVAITAEFIAKLLYELGGGRHEINFHRGLSATPERREIPGKSLPEFKIKTPFREGILTILKSAPPAPRARAEIRLPHLRLPLIRLPKIGAGLRRPSSRTLRIAAISLIIFSPILYFGSSIGLAAYRLSQLKQATEKLDFPRIRAAAASAATNLDRIGRWSPLARALAEASRATADLAEEGPVITTALENLLKSQRGEIPTPQSSEDFRNLAAAFSSAESHLTFAWLEAQSPAPRLLQKVANSTETLIREALAAVQFGQAFAQELDDLLGYSGERNYLILFENSTELRSGGGFIGSLAHLQLLRGEIKKLNFFDSYQFTNAAKALAHPADTKFLGRTAIPLFETNVEPSFVRTGQNVAMIFEAAQQTPIDGVIGVTLPLAENLLEITGGFELSEIGRKVDADSLFAVVTEEVEKDFFAGSTKKKRVMQALGEGLLERIFSLGKEDYARLAKAVWQASRDRNILLYLKNGGLPQALSELRVDGQVVSATGDYLAVFDNNYSAKVNGVWIKRSIDYRIFSPDKQGKVWADTTVTWNHTGTNAWPSNSINNLLLVLTPDGSRLMGAKLNGSPYHQVFPFKQDGKQGFAAYFSIPHSATTEFQLTYTLPENFSFQTIRSYRLVAQKQPGSVEDLFHFTFELPAGRDASSTNLQKTDNRLLFEGKMDRDLNFEIELKER